MHHAVSDAHDAGTIDQIVEVRQGDAEGTMQIARHVDVRAGGGSVAPALLHERGAARVANDQVRMRADG